MIDDSVGELEAVAARGERQFPAAGLGQAPTPADALAVAKATARKAKFAPRARPVPAQGGGGRGNRRGMEETEKLRPIIIEEEPEKPRLIIEEPLASAACGSSEVWVPPWATPQLQAVLLDELTRLSGRGSLTLVEGDEVLEALKAAQASSELLRRELPVLCEVAATSEVAVQFAVPLFYPTQPLIVVEARKANERFQVAPSVLRGLERALRQELSRLGEAQEPLALTAVLRWLGEEAPQLVKALTQKADAEHVAAKEAARAAAAAAEADAAARSLVGAPADETDVKQCRVADKYSTNWDLCTGFVKTGKCKNKNCKWRHEMPVEKTRAPPTPTLEAKAAPSSKLTQKSSKSKK